MDDDDLGDMSDIKPLGVGNGGGSIPAPWYQDQAAGPALCRVACQRFSRGTSNIGGEEVGEMRDRDGRRRPALRLHSTSLAKWEVV